MTFPRSWAEIDLRALRRNLKLCRAAKRPVMAMVKADAYGHGAVEVSRALRRAGVKQLAVALPAEAAELRGAGIKSEIVLVTPVLPPEVPGAVRMDLTVPVCRYRDLALLSEAARRQKKTVKVNLKIDTGLGRLGVEGAQLPSVAARLRMEEAAKRLKLEGVYTHLAAADSDRWYTREQMARLRAAVKYLETRRLKPRYVHAENSAALLYYKQGDFGLVRPGLMLYGLDPAPGFRLNPKLSPVLSLYSRVLQVRGLKAGESVSYGRRFKAKKVEAV